MTEWQLLQCNILQKMTSHGQYFVDNSRLVHGNITCSLSRREESYKHKLFACLIACMSAEDQKKIRVDRRVIGGYS